jgi:hypothetical protein
MQIMTNINSTTGEYSAAQLALYAKLAEAEVEAARGETGADFDVFAKELRESLRSRFITA